MDENNTLLPPAGPAEIPEFLQGDNWFEADIDGDFLDFAEPYRPPRYTLERMGVPFANVGELHVISGKPGNGKTGLISQFMAAVLCGRFGNTQRRTVTRTVRSEGGMESEQVIPSVVLYIDTEQGKDDTISVKNRVCTLAGIDYTKPCPQFQILRLRDTETAEERWQKILKAIYVVKPTDIFLDGMLDIVRDYNDQKECQPVIRKSMMLATHYDASMWIVLHENPMVDKLVGTLGSIVQRKVAEIFTVTKVKQTDLKERERNDLLPDIYFRVKQVKARGRDVSDWLFEYVANAGGWGAPVELEDSGAKVMSFEDMKATRELEECSERFGRYNWTSRGAHYTDLDRMLTSQGVTSNRAKKALFDLALEHSIIYKDANKLYHYNGLRQQQPNDKQESLPFAKPDGEDAPF